MTIIVIIIFIERVDALGALLSTLVHLLICPNSLMRRYYYFPL